MQRDCGSYCCNIVACGHFVIGKKIFFRVFGGLGGVSQAPRDRHRQRRVTAKLPPQPGLVLRILPYCKYIQSKRSSRLPFSSTGSGPAGVCGRGVRGVRRLVKISQKYPTARSAILKGRTNTMQAVSVNTRLLLLISQSYTWH